MPRPPKKPAPRTTPVPPDSSVALICVAAWILPGSGHLWLGRNRTGVVMLIVLLGMYAFGIWLQGEVFTFDLSQPLVALAALANLGAGGPYVLARVLGLGSGEVVAATYEFGNTFLVVAGLLNAMVVLDAYDIAEGRK